ncbi:ATP-binding cassette domain-containing protein, partial [Pseudomonas viridiflava]|uniref:ATP-binding cassette domain-containing protein n=1 Tax=Pseudomonas viridiflava TaxID=33069 RepID=UPI00196797C7
PGGERGVVFQDDALLPWQDVLANVAFGLELAGIGRAEREAKGRDMLALVDLSGFERRRIWQLSGGQRQRAWLAMILAQDAAIVLLDEPTTYLDISHQVELLDLMRAPSAEGK